MAFSDNKITVADLTGKGVTGMADTPNLTTAQMQQKLDEIAKEVIPPKFNSLCDALDLLGLSSLLTSASTSKMLYLRLNEYDQLEYSVNNVDYSLVASGKEILDPSIEADNSKKLGGQLPAYYQKTTDNALNTTSKLTTGAINEINTALGKVDTTANEAPPYSPSSTYAVGKYVSYQKHIYKCNTAILTAESWNASHWTQTTLGEEIETVNNSLTIHSTTFDGTTSHAIGDYVIYTDNSILYLYKFTSAGTAITSAVKVTGGVGVIANADGKAYVMGADSVLKKCSGVNSLRGTLTQNMASNTLTISTDFEPVSLILYGGISNVGSAIITYNTLTQDGLWIKINNNSPVTYAAGYSITMSNNGLTITVPSGCIIQSGSIYCVQ